MDYEQKYKEALERAKRLHSEPTGGTERIVCEQIFPELKESEDEKIRKELICFLETEIPQCNARDKYIAWLEEQKEFVSADFDDVWETADCDELTAPLEKYSKDAIKKMCHAWYDKGIELERRNWLEKQGEQKPTETVKWGQQEESCICQLESLVKEQWRQAEKVHNSVNIKKMSGLMFFLKTLNPNKKPQGKTALEAINEEKVDNANKVENEIEIPYGAKDSELIEESYNIPKGFHAEIDKDKVVIKKGEKPTWSEEDNVMIRCITLDLELLKNRDDGEAGKSAYQSEIDWLKSIMTRSTWKPSDEQMDALQYVCRNLNPPLSDKLGWDSLKTLELLYKILKKLY